MSIGVIGARGRWSDAPLQGPMRHAMVPQRAFLARVKLSVSLYGIVGSLTPADVIESRM